MFQASSLPPSRILSVSPFFRSQPNNLFRRVFSIGLLASSLVLIPNAQAQDKPVAALSPGLITIVAGNGNAGYSGDNGPATAATLNDEFDVAFDPLGNLYIADMVNEVIRKITASTGVITTFAGNGTQGSTGDGGPALQAEFVFPNSVTFDSAGNVYITELYGGIRKINSAGIITTVVAVNTTGYSGDGGPATAAELNRPFSVYVDTANDLYIADTGNNVIRRVDAITGIITTVAGNGYGSSAQYNDYCGDVGFDGVGGYTGDGGPATSAELFGPRSVAMDAAGDLYIADTCNNVVRKVTASTGIITTVAGNGFGAGGAYGSGGFTGDGGPATAAELDLPERILLDPAGDLYIGDSDNYRIRFVNPAGIITTIAGSGAAVPATNNVAATASGLHIEGLAFDSSYNLFVADSHANQILKIDVSQSALNFPTATIPGTYDLADGYETIALTNVGNSPLVFESEQVTAGFVDNPNQAQICGSLQPGSSCSIGFGFDPLIGAAGPVTGTSTITDNSAPLGTQTIYLTGTAMAGTTTTLVANPSTNLVAGEPITLTAIVVSDGGTAIPTGTITFAAAGGRVTKALDATGKAVYSGVVPPAGTYSLYATYNGAAEFIQSHSATIARTVTAPPPN